jgi:hypothetical protein
MAKSADQESLYMHASLICKEYETAANKAAIKGNREAAMVGFLPSLSAMDSMVNVSAAVLHTTGGDGFGTSTSALTAEEQKAETGYERYVREVKRQNACYPKDAGSPISYDGKVFGAHSRGWLWPEGSSLAPDICNEGANEMDACETFLDPNKQWQGWNATTPSAHAGFNVDITKAVSDLLGDPEKGSGVAAMIGNSTEDFLQDCINCSLSFNFDLQIKPINLLAEIEKLLKNIETALDFIKDRLDPFSTLKDLCALFAGIRWLCPMDLLLMLMALQALLRKYGMSMVQLSFDWTMIVGPIIKAIVDILVSALEQVLSAIMQPIDCIIGVLSSVDSLINTGIDTVLSVAGAGQDVVDNFYKDTGEQGVSPWFNSGASVFGSEMKVGTGPDWSGKGGSIVPERNFFGPPNNKTDWGTESRKDFHKRTGHVDAKSPPALTQKAVPDYYDSRAGTQKDRWGETAPSGKKDRQKEEAGKAQLNDINQITMTDETSIDEMLKNNTWKQISPLSKTIVSLNESKNWLRELFDNLIVAAKSLNQLVSGGLGLNITNCGLMLLIIDQIALWGILVELKLKWAKACKDIRENPDEVLEMFHRDWIGQRWQISEDGNILYGTSRTGCYVSGEIELPDCSTGVKRDERQKALEDLFVKCMEDARNEGEPEHANEVGRTRPD